MKLTMTGSIVLVAAFACAASAAELTHRWSFNGDYTDSVGGVTATTIGPQVSIKDGQVEMRGSGNGSGSLNMGQNLLDTQEATVEIWATQRMVKNWSRIFDYGAGTGAYFCLAWSQGATFVMDRAGSIINGTERNADNTMGPYELGVKYHITMTFTANATGLTAVRLMRRNAKTGMIEKEGTVELGGSFADIQDPTLYIGYSQYAGDWDAFADVDEVRIWKGILTDEQLTANAVRGPDDATPGSTELPVPTGPAFATWVGGAPATAADLENAANWSCTDADGNAVEGAVPGTATTVVIPGGETAFRIPVGVTPAWAGIRFGGPLAALQWGAIRYGVDRGGMSADFTTDWVHIPLATYSLMGITDSPGLCLSGGALAKSQFRFDGWFNVASGQEGFGRFTIEKFDDYMALLVDGALVLINHTWTTTYSANWYLTPGWHRFTIICGDTFGGQNQNLDPLTCAFADGTAIQFTALDIAAEQPATVKLTADSNLAALGPITLSNGITLDLNGHDLIVDDVTSDYMGTKVINTSGTPSTLYFMDEPAISGGINNLILENVQALRANAYVWTGTAGDGKFSTVGNWQLFNGTVPETVPMAGIPLIFTGAGGEIVNDLADLGGDSITFTPDARAFTITGNPFKEVPVVVNNSDATQTFANEVFFSGTYKVSSTTAPVNFAGGATATFPDESMRPSELGRRLVGKFTFTSDWVVPAAGSDIPWIVPDGSEVHGGLLTGTQHSHCAILRVDAGGSAYFSTITNGWDRGDVDIDGYLELSNEFIVRSCPTPSDNWSRFGRQGNIGTVKARRIAKAEHAWAQSFIPNLIVGEGGIGSVMQDYSWRFYTNTTITAYADFECLGVFNEGNTSDWGLTVQPDFTLTFNVPEGLTVTCGVGIFGEGAVRKTGAGTLVMGNSFDEIEGFTKVYTGGTTVGEGILKVDAPESVGADLLTLEAGATLGIKRGVVPTSVVTPRTGTATVMPYGDFSDITDTTKMQLAELDVGSSLDHLTLDTSEMNLHRGIAVTLKEIDGSVYLLFVRNGFTIFVK